MIELIYTVYPKLPERTDFMKKLLCIVLSVVLAVSSCFFASAMGEVEGKVSDYPVIIVPGYSSTNLYYGESLETGEAVWGLDFDHVLERVLARIADIGIGLGTFAFDDAELTDFDVNKNFCGQNDGKIFKSNNI